MIVIATAIDTAVTGTVGTVDEMTGAAGDGMTAGCALLILSKYAFSGILIHF